MTANGLLQIAIFCAVVTATAIPLGKYMARVFAGERNFLSPVLGPVERAIYRLSGVDAKKEQHWLTYTIAVLLFHVVCFATLYALLRLQYYLPFNPQGMTGVEPSLALNTAISFTTNTNWQNYGGETTLSYFTQMAGLTVHNFVSAAAGIVVVIALIRGFIRRSAQTIGNFWVDLTRCTLYILLPFSIVVDAGPGLAGHAAESGRLCRCHDAGRRQADDRARAGRLADRHQDRGHQRRRLLQRQRRASL